jgi:hypothetical protein
MGLTLIILQINKKQGHYICYISLHFDEDKKRSYEHSIAGPLSLYNAMFWFYFILVDLKKIQIGDRVSYIIPLLRP